MAEHVAAVKDGKLDYSYTDSSKKQSQATGSNLGYDQFLTLLCAEMQYQDPLEPTSNTEYVAQLATFSQLEATLSMQQSQENSMANDLVGKHVILKVEDENTGATNYVDGKVDYVLYEDGKTLLRYAQEVSAQKKLTKRHWSHDYYPVCILPVKFLMWMEFVVVIICNGHGPVDL